jgi:hypothetical protein
VKRIRRDFGAPVSFMDRNANEVKDGFIECGSYEDKAYDLQRMELDKGIQVTCVCTSVHVILKAKIGILHTCII